MGADVDHQVRREQQASRSPRRTWGRTKGTRSLGIGVAWSTGLAAAFALYTWLVIHWPPLSQFDQWLASERHFYSIFPLLRALNHIGQRTYCLPLLGIILAIVVWRHRLVRPVVVCGLAVFATNLAVLILKVWSGRGLPLKVAPDFFIGGQEYPSGHTANIIVVYGLCIFLLRHYGFISDRVRRILVWVLAGIGVLMTFVSLILRWHWLSDLVAGYLLGGSILALAIGIDVACWYRDQRLIAIEDAELDTEAGSTAL